MFYVSPKKMFINLKSKSANKDLLLKEDSIEILNMIFIDDMFKSIDLQLKQV